MRFPVIGKLIGLGVVVLALMVALQMVSGIVAERQSRLREAQASVADSMAAQQRLVGPMLQRRCEERWDTVIGEGKDRRTVAERREFTLAATPKSLDVDASAGLEPRYRGIFKVNGYALKAKVSAQWADLVALKPRAEHAPSQLACDAPVLLVAVGDARGLRQVALRVQGDPVDVRPGTPLKHLAQGFQAPLPATLVDAGAPVHAELLLELVGTEALAIAPVGDSTRVQLSSDWQHPSFQGRFLPLERDVGPQGFKARWQLSALATSAPRELLADAQQVESFGVAFIDPVNPYVLSDRATKYGLLFILLTFVGVGLVEVLGRLRVHPIQYLLVGCALAVFFLLLVSLTEHLAFGWAYLGASAACTLLLAFYGTFVLGGWRAGALFGAALGGLYGALYLLLQLEQTALVLGSLLLFAVLAAVMTATRRMDWYGLTAQWQGGEGREGRVG
ncbi:MAG TPA: cell envelope integrity protein CreD [Albitalea sp.]|uniref:cell envelope integrity protein CreD n=1 Tax=Piscinibacter sp. TaxID=1903157 RepID=UPI002ED173D9